MEGPTAAAAGASADDASGSDSTPMDVELAANVALGAPPAAAPASLSVPVPARPASPSSDGGSNGSGPRCVSPTHTHKRHITTVLMNAAYENHRASAPSPPKSPVRMRATSSEGVSSGAAAAAASSQPSSPVRRASSLGGDVSCSSDASTRSPVRIASRDRSPTNLSAPSPAHQPCYSPTRSTTHGLPASPMTPTRYKTTQRSAGSPSPTMPVQAGSRSPISAFWFPHGVPASPGSKQHTASTLAQLTATQPFGFDTDAIEQLTCSVLKLPKYCAPYVQQQCLLIQQNKRELLAMLKDSHAREIAKRLVRRRMQRLRRASGSAPASQRSSLGVLQAGGKADVASSSDMSLDDAGLACEVASSPSSARGGVAMSAMLSPTATSDQLAASRGRNESTTSTSSSVQTMLSAPSLPNSPPSSCNNARTSPVDENTLDQTAEALLTPLSISAASPSERHHSAADHSDASLLNVSALDDTAQANTSTADDDDAAADATDTAALASYDPAAEQRVLPATFSYYFSNHLEKFKDPATRFFRVLQSQIDYLMDDPNTLTAADAAPMTMQLNGEDAAGQSTPQRIRVAPPLHIPSPRTVPITVLSSPPPSVSLPLPSPSVPAMSPSSSFLTRAHFGPLLDSILSTHPGLEFLAATPEFQQKYAQTCIERIFYALDSKGSGKLSLADVRRSPLLSEVCKLQDNPDINESLLYFSYQHFYVLYCKFWELDSPDHDGYLSLANLLEYENRALSTRICQRIMDQCAKQGHAQQQQQLQPQQEGEEESKAADVAIEEGPAAAASSVDAPDADEFPAGERGLDDASLHTASMDYAQFITFMLNEVDKNTPQSLAYWFRLVDLDHDHVLSLFELDWFFSEQVEKIQALSSDVIRWTDIVCQLLDMVKASTDEVQRHGALPVPSAAIERMPTPPPAAEALTSPPHRLHSSPPPLSASSLAYEFSTCHLTRKDLARSHLQSYFFNLFFNLPRFLTHESRDPAKARAQHEAQEKGISDWESYAAATYQALVANEELQARAAEQQHQHLQDQQHTDDGDYSAGDYLTGPFAQDNDDDTGMPEQLDEEEPQQQQHVVQRSPKRQADAERRAQQAQEAEGGDDADMHEGESDDAARRAHTRAPVAAMTANMSPEEREFLERRWGIGSGPEAAAEASGVQIYRAPGSHCFIVQDEEEELSPESPVAPPAAAAASAAHAQMPAAAAMLLAQAHPSQHSQSPVGQSSPSKSCGSVSALLHDRERLRQEEREWSALQRKIHSSPPKESIEASAADDEDGASPRASSHPISIPATSSSNKTHTQLNGPVASLTGRPSSSISPPEGDASNSPPYAVAMSTAPRRTSPHAKALAGTVVAKQHAGKENEDGTHANGGFKRQLFAEKQPLGATRPNQAWQ